MSPRYEIEYHQPVKDEHGQPVDAPDRIVRTLAMGDTPEAALESVKGYLGPEYDDFDHDLTVVTEQPYVPEPEPEQQDDLP